MIAVIDYGMGNLGSVAKALTALGGRFEVVDDPAKLGAYTSILLPGVGNFGDGMENLRRRGFDRALRAWDAAGKPLGGICLGMQMMLDSSEEAPGVAGLGLIRGAVRRFPAGKEKVPQIGWNQVVKVTPHPVTADLADGEFFYFVHSFCVPAGTAQEIGRSSYGIPFASAIAVSPRCFGVQFHPEKSQGAGLRLLENYLRLAAAAGA